MIKVTQIEGKGRGVVATCYIHSGEEITRGPVISFPEGATDRTPFFELVTWSDGQEHLTLAAHTLCNHSFDPNCECKFLDGWDTLIAKRDISEGEELTLDYRELDK